LGAGPDPFAGRFEVGLWRRGHAAPEFGGVERFDSGGAVVRRELNVPYEGDGEVAVLEV